DPRPEHWTELIAHREDVMIEDVDVFAGHYVTQERDDGLTRLRVIEIASGVSHFVQFPEPTYEVDAEPNAEFVTPRYRFRYQSLITPASVFDYDMTARTLTLLKQTEVLGGYEPARYRSERIHATAADGTRVPIPLIARGDTAPDRLVIEGGSAGGLLIGAVLNMRPELFRAAVMRVPFVDVINTMLDESLPLTVGEFEEWGNPKILAQYAYMKTYCPY